MNLSHYLKKISFYKILNLLINFLSYIRAVLFKNMYHPGFPASISIEPVNYCNLRCLECPAGLGVLTRPKGKLSFDDYKNIIEQIYKKTISVILYFQGEPYLHPQIIEMIEYANKKKLYTIISTNGHFFNPENARKTVNSRLDELIISFDGTTQQTYESYRQGGDLNVVKQGIENIVKAKKRLNSRYPYIKLQFLVLKSNEHQIESAKQFAQNTGVDKIEFKTAQIYDYKKGSDLIPENSRYSRYNKKQSGQYQIKNKLANRCFRLWNTSVITWQGHVLPCCFDKDADFVMGNTFTTKFQSLWNSAAYKNFRKKVFTKRKKITICRNCTQGLRI